MDKQQNISTFSEVLTSGLNDIVEISNDFGYNFISFYIDVPLDSVIQFELTFDGVNWDTFSLRSSLEDVFKTNCSMDCALLGSIIGAKAIRFKTIVAGSGVGSVTGVMNRTTATLESIEFGYPPHRFGFTPIHKDASFTTTQSGTVLWTPDTDKTIVVTDLDIIVGGTADGTITVFNGAGDIEGSRLFKGAVDVSNNKQFSYVKSFKTPFVGTKNGTISITTTADMTVDIILHGYEF